MDSNALTILIADRDEPAREQLIQLLNQSGLLGVYTEVESVEAALAACRHAHVACVMIDAQLLQEKSELKHLTALCKQSPDTAMMIVVSQEDDRIAAEAFKRGVSAYIIKNNPSATLIRQSLTSAIEKQTFKKRLAIQEADIRLEAVIREALEKQAFYLCYQPVYHVHDISLYGFEVLLRWDDKIVGQLPIEQVIRVAEATGLIVPLGDWVMQEAFRQYKSWQLKDESTIKLAINFSPIQLYDPNLLAKINRLITLYHIDPRILLVEITESVAVKDCTFLHAISLALQKMGVDIFIDDFGKSYASISMIQHLPIGGLKIDGSCIEQIEKNKKHRDLLASIVLFANNMGLCVILEGIETQAQLDWLKYFKNEKVQGNYLSKPLSSDEVVNLLRSTGRLY